MKNNILTVNSINKILFCLTFIIKYFTDALYVAQGRDGFAVSSKYITLILGIICSYIIIQKRKEQGIKIVFTNEFLRILFVVAIFLLFSLFYVLISGKATKQTINDLLYIVLAIIYAYGIINSFYFEDINNCMKFLLIMSIIAYVLEIGTSNFTIANIINSSFLDSSSVFESSYSASGSMIMCTFFCYYRKQWKWTLLSFAFCLLTFKRMNIVFAVFFLLYPVFFNINKPIKRKIIVLLMVLFTSCTILLYYLYQAQNAELFENIFHISATQLSTGRNLYLQNVINRGFESFGYGSSTVVNGKSIEMDFIKIYIELGIIPLMVFIWNYYNISYKNSYCFWIMTQNMLNFLTSHSLTSVFNWGLRFIVIAFIIYRVQIKCSGFLNKEIKYIEMDT